jgi:hypothetical protein
MHFSGPEFRLVLFSKHLGKCSGQQVVVHEVGDLWRCGGVLPLS